MIDILREFISLKLLKTYGFPISYALILVLKDYKVLATIRSNAIQQKG